MNTTITSKGGRGMGRRERSEGRVMKGRERRERKGGDKTRRERRGRQ
jgi:hypothetical protein